MKVKTIEMSPEMISVANVLRSFRYWPRIFALLRKTQPKYLTYILIANGLNGLAPVVTLIIMQELINDVVKGMEVGFHIVVRDFIYLAAVALFNQLISIFQSYYEKLFETLLSNRINVLIMEKSISLTLSDFENAKIQDQLKRAQSEAGYRPFQVFKQILSIISGVITFFSSSAVLLVWKWWAALLILVIPFSSFISFLRQGQREFLVDWNRAPKWRESWYLSFLLTRDSTFKEIKLYQLGPYLLSKYRSIFKEFFEQDKKLVKRRTLISLLFQLLNQAVTSGMILMVLWSAFIREILLGNLVGTIQAINLAQTMSQNLVHNLLSLCQNNLYIEQLFAYLDLVPNYQFKCDEKDNDEHAVNKLKKGERTVSLSTLESVEFRNVSFQYPGTQCSALTNINLTLKRGETLAIVGRNGSGKTTLVKLLTQLYQNFNGDILINGVSIKSYDRETLRNHIGIVFQDFVQYEMPMRQNIGFGDISHIEHDEELMKAATRSGIEELINDQLPQKLDTQLGRWFEEGYQLSGGQWQRVAIARAFMRDADLYILDEPSSFLDPEAENEVFQKFRDLVKNRIGLFISHRFSSVRFADRILVIDQGRVVEQGNHKDLISLNGVYAKLYNLQVSAYVKRDNDYCQEEIAL